MKKQNKKTKWTLFWDMHSGGGSKEKQDKIYIEAPIEEAKIIFYNRFGHNPERVTCTCCGGDYSISEEDSLEEASGFHRNCRFGYLDKDGNEVPKERAWISGEGMVNGAVKSTCFEEEDREEIDDMKKKYPDSDWEEYKKHITIKKYERQKGVLIIRKEEIKLKERKGDVPEQGYVWK